MLNAQGASRVCHNVCHKMESHLQMPMNNCWQRKIPENHEQRLRNVQNLLSQASCSEQVLSTAPLSTSLTTHAISKEILPIIPSLGREQLLDLGVHVA